MYPFFKLTFHALLGMLLWNSNAGGVGPSGGDSLKVAPYGDLKPYADLRAKPYEYHGPERELAEPTDLEEVRIGLFGPLKRTDAVSQGRSMRRGAELAIAEANAAGGHRGKPFEPVFRSDDQIWGSAREVARLVYEDKVWAVMGSIGSESTHIAEQIITKAHVVLIGPASTDPSLTQINIPWMFRCMPDDAHIARVLGTHLFQDRGVTKVAAIASNASDSRIGVSEFEKTARRLGRPLALSLKYDAGAPDFSRPLDLIERAGAEALVVWGRPEEAARLIRKIRARGMTQPVFGGPALAFPEFLKRAGTFAEGVTVAAPCDLWRDDPRLRTFRQQFSERYGAPPDIIAAYAYDGMNLLIRAIRAGGLNRAKIRDALAEIRRFHGVTGEIRFDGSGSNVSPPVLVVVRDGHFCKQASN
ncbi:MAG: ABC transporter substrate-binding protein [Candidatus Latescibacteria bacterium]|nr:ABC transporter substrate-binding protein [Candidatus Latescibacterota bacterium]